MNKLNSKGRNSQIIRIFSLQDYKVIDLQRVNFENNSLGDLKKDDSELIEVNKIKDIK